LRKYISGEKTNSMYTLSKPFVLWLTGLPCSGKTTLAGANEKKFSKNDHFSITVLGGDEFKSKYCKDLGFLIEDLLPTIFV